MNSGLHEQLHQNRNSHKTVNNRRNSGQQIDKRISQTAYSFRGNAGKPQGSSDTDKKRPKNGQKRYINRCCDKIENAERSGSCKINGHPDPPENKFPRADLVKKRQRLLYNKKNDKSKRQHCHR